MAKPTLTALASGVMARLGQLTVQTAKKARVSAEKAAHKSLIEVNKLLDEAIEATKPAETVVSGSAKLPAASAAKKPSKAATKKTLPRAATAKRSDKR